MKFFISTFLVFTTLCGCASPSSKRHSQEIGVKEVKVVSTPFETVKTTGWFAIGGVGMTESIGKTEIAFRSILASPSAREQFISLLSTATIAGQLYALLGLKLLRDPSFEASSHKYLLIDTDVLVPNGDVILKKTVHNITKSISEGRYDSVFHN